MWLSEASQLRAGLIQIERYACAGRNALCCCSVCSDWDVLSQAMSVAAAVGVVELAAGLLAGVYGTACSVQMMLLL